MKIWIILALMWINTWAVIMIKSVNTDELNDGMQGTISGSETTYSGNVDSQSLGIDADTYYNADSTILSGYISRSFAKQSHIIQHDSGTLHMGALYHMPDTSTRFEVLGQYSFDTIEKIAYDYQLGGGLRYRVIDDDLERLALHIGVFKTKKKYMDEDPIFAYRFNLIATYKLERGENMFPVFEWMVMLQPRVDIPSNIQIRAQEETHFSLDQKWDVTLKIIYDFDDKAPLGTRRTTLMQQLSLDYAF